MTAAEEDTADPVWAFLHALPPRISRQLNRTERLVAHLHAATRHGWTPRQLAEHCTRSNDAVNPAGVVMYRLAWCADNPPDLGTGDTNRVPFCSPECRDNQGWLLDDDRNPIGRCPCRTQEAHPQ